MRRKVIAALIAGQLFYALSDVLMWQRIFEANHLWKFDAEYQTGHVVILIALISTGMILLYDAGLWAALYCLAFYTLAFGGVADVLYYWLDGRGIPAACPWLDGNRLILIHPATGTSVLISAGLWIAFWSATLGLAPRLRRSFRFQLA